MIAISSSSFDWKACLLEFLYIFIEYSKYSEANNGESRACMYARKATP